MDEPEDFGVTDENAMIRQVRNSEGVMARLRGPWRRIVLLERIARGAGATRWYLLHDRSAFEQVIAALRPGSRVTFYFRGPMHTEPLSEEVQGAMFEAVGEHDEIVIAFPVPGQLELRAELVSGPSELTDFLMQPDPPADVVWGAFPGTEELDSFTVELVDADGVLRAHPH